MAMGLLQGPRLIAWTTKSPIRGNHWVAIGCKELLRAYCPKIYTVYGGIPRRHQQQPHRTSFIQNVFESVLKSNSKNYQAKFKIAVRRFIETLMNNTLPFQNILYQILATNQKSLLHLNNSNTFAISTIAIPTYIIFC